MKNKIMRISIVLIAVLLSFGLAGCPNAGEEEKSSGALLTGIRFGTTDDTIEAETKLPPPIAFKDYLAGNAFSTVEVGSVMVKSAPAFGLPVTLTVSSKASALVVRGTSLPGDEVFEELGVRSGGTITPTLTNNNYIVVRVTAENKRDVNYYAFRVSVQGDQSALTNFTYTIAGETSPALPTRVPIDHGVASTGAIAEVNWNNVRKGTIELSNATKTGVFNATASAAVEPGITKEFAVGTGTTVPATFTPSLESRTFVDGELIYIRVTSQNGVNRSLYIIEVHLGRDANLTSVTFSVPGGQEPAEASLGVPNASAAAIIAENHGLFEPGRPQPVDGFTFAATPRDAEATVEWAIGKTATVPTTFGTTALLKFAAGDFLYVKVTSANGAATLYYKIEVILSSEVILFYGQPKIRDTTNRTYIDPMWNDAKHIAMDVSRINLAEQAGSFGFLNPVDSSKSGHTIAWAKAMWDDEGLYVYAHVDIYDFYNSQADKTASRVTTRTVTVGEDHNCDNVEIFTNERLQSRTTGNFGSQYRVGPPAVADQQDNYGAISGDSSFSGAIDLFSDSNNYSSWIRVEGGKQVGYTVIAKVPWVYVTHAEATDVFATDGLIKVEGTDKGPTIGLELQLNTSSSSGSRDAILTWNGINSQAYQNVRSFGRATLVMGNATRVPPTAQAPTITTQPADRGYTQTQLTNPEYTGSLSVVASIPGGTLTYQWYKGTSAAQVTAEVAAQAIAGATLDTYKPASNLTVGTHYYYVVVTNTRGSGASLTTAKTISRTATVTVTDVEKPVFAYHPRSRTYNVGSTAQQLQANINPISGATPTFAWYSATTATGAGSAIAGETTITLPAAKIATTTAGDTWYWLVATNGSQTTASEKAQITVVAAGTAIDFTMDFYGEGTHGGLLSTLRTGDWNVFEEMKISLGADFDISKYDRYTFDYRTYTGATGDQLVTGNLSMRINWLHDDTASGETGFVTVLKTPSGMAGSDYEGWWFADQGLQQGPRTRVLIPAYIEAPGVDLVAPNASLPGGASARTGAVYEVRPLKFMTLQRTTAAVNRIEIMRIQFHLKPVVTAADPLVVPLVFQIKDGVTIDKVPASQNYQGLSARLDIPAHFNSTSYNRVTVYADAYDENDVLLTSGSLWSATLFEPWNASSPTQGYGDDTDGSFPQWGTPGRLVNFANDATGRFGTSASISLDKVPHGVRVERAGNVSTCPTRALKLVKVVFWHTEKPYTPNPADPDPITPASRLIGEPGTISRAGLDVVVGTSMASLISADYFQAGGNAQVGSTAGIVYVTGTDGGGSNYLQILPPAFAALPTPLEPGFQYILRARGRTSAALGGGRLEFHEIGGGNQGDSVVGSSPWDIPASFNFTYTLTASNIQRGLRIFANRWSDGGLPADFVFSIDDFVIYKMGPQAIDGLSRVSLVRNDNGAGAINWWLIVGGATPTFSLGEQTIALAGVSANGGLGLQGSNGVFPSGSVENITTGVRFVYRGTGTAGTTVRMIDSANAVLTDDVTIKADGTFEVVYNPNAAAIDSLKTKTGGTVVVRIAPGGTNGATAFTVTGLWFGTPTNP